MIHSKASKRKYSVDPFVTNVKCAPCFTGEARLGTKARRVLGIGIVLWEVVCWNGKWDNTISHTGQIWIANAWSAVVSWTELPNAMRLFNHLTGELMENACRPLFDIYWEILYIDFQIVYFWKANYGTSDKFIRPDFKLQNNEKW